jgi:hypothetical protein
VLIVVCVRIRCSQRQSRRRYLYGTGIKHDDNDKVQYQDTLKNKTYEKLHAIDSAVSDQVPISTVPLRSYINYLQHCYYYDFHDQCSSYDIPKLIFKQDIIDQFQSLIDNHDEFVRCLLEILLKSANKKLLTSLLLVQRYHLKHFLLFNHDWIYFHICLLTAYDGFLSNQMTSIFFQLYSHLKQKIRSGPIDSIEQTSSYYSLNNHTILHDQSILFNPVQIIVHIDYQTTDDIISINVTCLTCDTICQVKGKILDQLYNMYKHLVPSITIEQCQLYLLTNMKSNPNSCSTSSCSSSTTSSSNMPLAKKSLLTQFFFNRSLKYSTTTTTTTTLNDSYRDSILLLLNDTDNTNEQVNHCKKLNTLQHYGIVNDGYEFKMILPKLNKSIDYISQSMHSPHLGKSTRSMFSRMSICVVTCNTCLSTRQTPQISDMSIVLRFDCDSY